MHCIEGVLKGCRGKRVHEGGQWGEDLLKGALDGGTGEGAYVG